MLTSDAVQVVRAVLERCRQRYPTVALSFESYCARLEEILAAGHRGHGEDKRGATPICPDCSELLRQMHHEDLFLATACAGGDRIAWEYFTDEYLALLRRFAQHACRSCDASEDLAQDLIAKLLGESLNAAIKERRSVQGAGACGLNENMTSPNRLGSYNGRGSLAGWLRAAVSHAAIDGFRRAARQVSLEEMEEEGRLPQPGNPQPEDPPDERLDARWGPVLAQALKEELAGLCARDRLLLNLYYIESIPLKAIGLQFGVHEATASRWLERLRRGVRKRVEHKLRKTHGLTARDLESLWHWISEAQAPAPEPVRPMSPQNAQYHKKVQGGIV